MEDGKDGMWKDGKIPIFLNRSVKRNMIIKGVIEIELNGDSNLPKFQPSKSKSLKRNKL